MHSFTSLQTQTAFSFVFMIFSGNSSISLKKSPRIWQDHFNLFEVGKIFNEEVSNKFMVDFESRSGDNTNRSNQTGSETF